MKNFRSVVASLLSLTAISAFADTENLLSEDFDGVSNNSWASTTYLGSKTTEADCNFGSGTWRVYYTAVAPKAVRLGLASTYGYVISPVIELTNYVESASVKVSFYAARVNGSNSDGQIKLTLLDETDSSLGQEYQTGELLQFTTNGSELPASCANNGGGDPIECVFENVPSKFKLKFQSVKDGRDALDTIRVKQILVDDPLAVPSNLTVSGDPEAHSFTAVWTGDANATGYAVELYLVYDGEEVFVDEFTSTTESCDFTGLLADSTYRYRVRAFDSTQTHRNTDWSALSSDVVTALPASDVVFVYAEGDAVFDSVYSKSTKTITVSATIGGVSSVVSGYSFEPDFTPSAAPSFCDGVFSWTPDDEDSGDHEVRFTAQDGEGNFYIAETPVAFTVVNRPELESVWPSVDDITCNSFSLEWGGQDQLRLDHFALRVWYGSCDMGSETTDKETFYEWYDNYRVKNSEYFPQGWSVDCTDRYDNANYPLKVAWNGCKVITKKYPRPVTEFSFRVQKYTNDLNFNLYASRGGAEDSDWVLVDNAVKAENGVKTYNFSESAGYRRFKIVRPSAKASDGGNGNFGVGSFSATYVGAGTHFVVGSKDEPVVLDKETASYVLENLKSYREYFVQFVTCGTSGEEKGLYAGNGTREFYTRVMTLEDTEKAPPSVVTVY